MSSTRKRISVNWIRKKIMGINKKKGKKKRDIRINVEKLSPDLIDRIKNKMKIGE